MRPPSSIARALLEEEGPEAESPKDQLFNLLSARPLQGVPPTAGESRYFKLVRLFQKRRRTHIKLGRNTWADFYGDLTTPEAPGSVITVTLHRTVIARLEPDGSGTYYNGGWNTPTTADRISDWLVGGWRVYTWSDPKTKRPGIRRKGDWYWWNPSSGYGAERLPDTRQPFSDGDHIDAQGTLHPQADPLFIPRRRPRQPPAQLESKGGGVYADLTGPKPEYYAKCPECGHVHGMYPSFASATHHKVCGTCRYEKVMQFKSDLEKAARPRTPKERQRPPWPISVKESDDFDGGAKDLLSQTMDDWVMRALYELPDHVGDAVTLVDPAEHDPDDEPDRIIVKTHRNETNYFYHVYRDESLAREAAFRRASTDLMENPESYPAVWLEMFCDGDVLRRVIAMDDPGIRDADNPFQYMRRQFGSDVIHDYLDHANFDYDAAVENLLNSEGLEHIMAADHRKITLETGAVAFLQ